MNQPDNRHSILLAADDVEVLRHAVVHFPRHRFFPIAARAGTQVAEGLMERPIAMAIIHQDLSDMKGIDLCRWLREYGAEVIVLLTRGLPPRARPGAPFDVAVKFPPNIPGMFADTINNLVRNNLKSGVEKFIADVEQRTQIMDQQDYYALLGLPVGANYDQIRNVYDDFSLRYHPDKHLALREEPVFELLNHYYKRVGEAYRVLTSDTKRPQYDRLLSREGVLRYDQSVREKEGPASLEDLSDNARVKRFLKLAQVSLTSGNLSTALQNLKFAQSLDSDNDLIADKVAELQAQLRGG